MFLCYLMNIEDNNLKIHMVWEQFGLYFFKLLFRMPFTFLAFERTLISPFVPPAAAPSPAHHLPTFPPLRKIWERMESFLSAQSCALDSYYFIWATQSCWPTVDSNTGWQLSLHVVWSSPLVKSPAVLGWGHPHLPLMPQPLTAV